MNIVRYGIASLISVALHLSLMLANEAKPVLAMPAGSTSSSVSLSFVAPPPQLTESEPTAKPIEKKTPVTQERAPQKTAPQPPIKTPAAVSKPKPKVEQKKVEQKIAQKEPVVQQLKPKRVTTQPKQDELKQYKPKQDSKNDVVEQQTATKESTAEPTKETPKTVVNSGVSSKPVVVEKPSFLSRPVSPRYPRIARKRGIEGTATYEIWIDATGKQTQHILISSSGADILDQSALDAIKQWEFSSHKIDGVAIAHRIRIPVRFNLD